MRTIMIVAALSAGLISGGCTRETYLSLTENSREQFEEEIKDHKQDENQGVVITLSLKNGIEVNGELLSVRDRAVTVSTEQFAAAEELASRTFPVAIVPSNNIRKLRIHGNQVLGQGLVMGGFVGTFVGKELGSSLRDEDWPLQDAEVFFSLVGLVLGGLYGSLVGYASSTEDIVLWDVRTGSDLSLLKPLARYPDREPEYLRVMQ